MMFTISIACSSSYTRVRVSSDPVQPCNPTTNEPPTQTRMPSSPKTRGEKSNAAIRSFDGRKNKSGSVSIRALWKEHNPALKILSSMEAEKRKRKESFVCTNHKQEGEEKRQKRLKMCVGECVCARVGEVAFSSMCHAGRVWSPFIRSCGIQKRKMLVY